MGEVRPLLRRFHYIGDQCADPTLVFTWRTSGGLYGDCGDPVAAAVFAPPASFCWGKDAIELVRLVRDDSMKRPLTEFLALCWKSIRKLNKYSIVIAYADPSVGHHGGIYQSGNWLYLRRSSRKVVYVSSDGRRQSQRSFDQRTSRKNLDTATWTATRGSAKLTYLYPLTKAARRLWTPQSKPYEKPDHLPIPTHIEGGLDNRNTPAVHSPHGSNTDVLVSHVEGTHQAD
jgi:hypothetical protein